MKVSRKIRKFSKSKSKTFYKSRKNNKKNKNKFIQKGGINSKEEQDKFIVDTYDNISKIKISTKTVEELDTLKETYCNQMYNLIYKQKHLFTNNYLAKLIINMFLPFLYKLNKKDFETDFDLKFKEYEEFEKKVSFIPEYGSELKKYGLTNLTKCPEKSLEILNTCKDTEKYSVMDSVRFISDYVNNIKYLCEKVNDDTIYRINEYKDLSKIDEGEYKYCMLPNETLCLFQGNHSAGACGQPVICAGDITIKNHQITSIDNNSGHYKPHFIMLQKLIEILKIKKILVNQEIDTIINGISTTFKF